MLLVKHYVAPSQIHGLGLFVSEPIKQGATVWRYEPQYDVEIPEKLLGYLLDPDIEVLIRHAEYIPDLRAFRLGNDADIFMNHSDIPSLIDFGDEMIAATDIAPGTELTCDYRKVCVLDFDPKSWPPTEDET